MSCAMRTWRRAENSGRPAFGNACVGIALRPIGRGSSARNLWQSLQTEQAIIEDQDIIIS